MCSAVQETALPSIYRVGVRLMSWILIFPPYCPLGWVSLSILAIECPFCVQMMSDTGFDDGTVQVNVKVLVPSATISLLPVKLTVEGPTEKYKSHKNDIEVYTLKNILQFGLVCILN